MTLDQRIDDMVLLGRVNGFRTLFSQFVRNAEQASHCDVVDKIER